MKTFAALVVCVLLIAAKIEIGNMILNWGAAPQTADSASQAFSPDVGSSPSVQGHSVRQPIVFTRSQVVPLVDDQPVVQSSLRSPTSQNSNGIRSAGASQLDSGAAHTASKASSATAPNKLDGDSSDNNMKVRLNDLSDRVDKNRAAMEAASKELDQVVLAIREQVMVSAEHVRAMKELAAAQEILDHSKNDADRINAATQKLNAKSVLGAVDQEVESSLAMWHARQKLAVAQTEYHNSMSEYAALAISMQSERKRPIDGLNKSSPSNPTAKASNIVPSASTGKRELPQDISQAWKPPPTMEEKMREARRYELEEAQSHYHIAESALHVARRELVSLEFQRDQASDSLSQEAIDREIQHAQENVDRCQRDVDNLEDRVMSLQDQE